jgi:hypothetical protein
VQRASSWEGKEDVPNGPVFYDTLVQFFHH